MQLISHFHLVLTLRMHGIVIPLPCFLVAWCLMKHSDSFTFTLQGKVVHSQTRGNVSYKCLSLSFLLLPLSVKCFVSLQFLNPETVGRTPWMGDQPAARPLPTQTQNKHRQTPMPSVGFEPTVPVFEQAKTVHALDHVATMMGSYKSNGKYLHDQICTYFL
jgi:hypothetical protein